MFFRAIIALILALLCVPLAIHAGDSKKKLPVLVIDGDGARKEVIQRNNFFVVTALESDPDKAYQVFSEERGGADAAKALERGDLSRFKSILRAANGTSSVLRPPYNPSAGAIFAVTHLTLSKLS